MSYLLIKSLHGLLAGQLRRRLESAASNRPPSLSVTLAGLFGLMGAVVLLVVVKPF